MEYEIDIYFSDLTEEKRKELLEKAKISGPEEANWDLLPLTTITISEE